MSWNMMAMNSYTFFFPSGSCSYILLKEAEELTWGSSYNPLPTSKAVQEKDSGVGDEFIELEF
jgi:hypothetical protein